MYSKTIQHQYLALKWPTLADIDSPKTLVLGSFNPFNSSGDNVDYYYGRESNFFWQAVADINDYDVTYYFDKVKGLERKLATMHESFVLADVIDSVHLQSESAAAVDEFIENKILKNFADQHIWLGYTDTMNSRIHLSRNYNLDIMAFLQNSNSIDKVIHTMGRNSLSENKVSPIEGPQGFGQYIKTIEDICRDKGIKFVRAAVSPSGYAINNGATDYTTLKQYYKTHLNL